MQTIQNPGRRSKQPENPEAPENDASRTSQYRKAAQDSISLHGGPWGGCGPCHDLEDQLLAAIAAPAKQWLRTLAAWRKHLALD